MLTQPEPITLSPQPDSHFLKYALFALAGFLLLAAGAAGGYWYGIRNEKPQPETQTQTSKLLTTPSVNPYNTIYDLTKTASLSGKIRFITREYSPDNDSNYKTLFKVVTVDLSTLGRENTYQSSSSYFWDLTADGRFLSTKEDIKNESAKDGSQKFQLIDLTAGKVIFSANNFGGPDSVSAELIYNKYLVVRRGMGLQEILDPETGKVIAEHPLVPFASFTWSFSPDLRYLVYLKASYYYGEGMGPMTTSLGFIDLVKNPGQNIEPFGATDHWNDDYLCWKENQLLFKRTLYKDLKEDLIEETQIIKIDPSNKHTEILCEYNCDEEKFKSTCDRNPFDEQEKQNYEQINNIKRLVPAKLKDTSSLSFSSDKKFILLEAGNPDNNNQRAVYIIDLLSQKTHFVGDGTNPRWVR